MIIHLQTDPSIIPLEHIGPRWRDHKSALIWIIVILLQPQRLPHDSECVWLLWHALPYTILIGVLSRIAFGGLSLADQIASGFSTGIVLGCLVTLVFHVEVAILWRTAVANRGLIALRTAMLVGLALEIAASHEPAFVLSIPFGLLPSFGAFAAWSTLILAPALFFFIHVCLVWPTPRGRLYRYHPVAWNLIARGFYGGGLFPGLDRLLVAYGEEEKGLALLEIERLITNHPGHKHAALCAKAAFLVRKAVPATDLTSLEDILQGLPAGQKRPLNQIPTIKCWMRQVTTLQVALNSTNLPVLRQQAAQLLCVEIGRFLGRLAGLKGVLAPEFQKAASHWEQIARHQLEETKAVASGELRPQVFRAGDALSRNQVAFVARDHGLLELRNELARRAVHRPLVLHGGPRMGKSTILRNLDLYVPTKFAVAVMAMKERELYSSVGSLVFRMAQGLALHAQAGELPCHLSDFSRFLEDYDARLQIQDKEVVLAIDDYNIIDAKIGERVLPEKLLEIVLDSMRVHGRIRWLFAGSQQLAELPNAPWTSYFGNARTLDVQSFSHAETQELLTEPLKHCSLWAKGSVQRPRCEPAFWGDGGIEKIHVAAAGWPYFVHLIAETVIALTNAEHATYVTADLLNRALDRAIVRGHDVVHELLYGDCSSSGEWNYLRGFRDKASQTAPQDNLIAQALLRRQLIATEGGRWRLRVPLLVRWLQSHR